VVPAHRDGDGRLAGRSHLFLGETLDADHVEAGYEAGVLTLRIPIVETAEPRKIAISAGEQHQAKQIDA
jgi:HSP20 family protein